MTTEVHGFPYAHEVVAGLPDLGDAIHTYEASKVDMVHFAKLFLAAGLEDVVGMTVMHRHYGVAEDQVIFETISGTQAGGDLKFVCQATKYADVGERMVPYIIRYDAERKQWVGVEWTTASAGDAATFFDRLIAEKDFLAMMARELTSRGLESSLGLTITHRFFLTDPETQVLCETTDHATNVSTTVPVPKDEVAAMGKAAIPAHYKFNKPAGYDEGTAADGAFDEAIAKQTCVWCCHNC